MARRAGGVTFKARFIGNVRTEACGVADFDGLVLHMGTTKENGRLLTKGGRVLMCIAHGRDIPAAQQKVYAEIQKIHCDNLFYRKDIAHWAL